MRIEDKIIQLLIESFAEECIDTINDQKHPENGPFNFGIASADAAVRRVKTKWVDKLTNNNEEENDKIY